ncbi:MAG: holin, partial [Acutalibacter sp.]|nr:holin [Acutalibacter sp.]
MTKKWWKAAGVRAVKTVAQAAVAAIGTTAMLSEVDWLVVASTALLAGV